MSPLEAARLIADHSATPGTSRSRCAEAIMSDPDVFADQYALAARGADRQVFAALLDAHAALAAYHAARKEPTP